MTLKRGIFYVFIANIVNFLANLLTSFVLPKFLSIDAYSNLKTFQFYIGYVGIMHLGYVDGTYLKYGGKKIQDIDYDELAIDIATIRFFQFIVSLSGCVFCYIYKDYVLLACMVSIFPQNMKVYYSSLFRACGNFKRYAQITNYYSLLTMFINIFLLSQNNCHYQFNKVFSLHLKSLI